MVSWVVVGRLGRVWLLGLGMKQFFWRFWISESFFREWLRLDRSKSLFGDTKIMAELNISVRWTLVLCGPKALALARAPRADSWLRVEAMMNFGAE
jgi:hypothetical protein